MMSPPNFHSIKYLKQLLLATSLVALTACGGGGGGGDDDDDTPPVATNKNPTVSISSDSSVTEGGELVLQATATDSDGTIASYAWQQTSGPDLTLTGSDTSTLTITAPEIEDDADVVVSLTVTDDDGATATATVTIELKRKVLSVTITGIVTDEPIINSSIVVQIGDEQFEITADAQGRYSVNIEVDDSDADELVKLVALGNNSIDPGVEFVSQLKSIATLVSQAGADGTLSKDENFGVNITNVSTAEFALLSRDGTNIDSEQALDEALLAVDADEKLLLAALIKIIVDNDDYELPEGVDSTLDLISSAEQIDDFINTVESQDPGLIDSTKEEIKDDDELVDQTINNLTGNYLLMQPQYYRTSVGQFEFNNDGTGYVSLLDVDTDFSWSQQEQDITITLAEPALMSCFVVTDGNDEQLDVCEYLVELDLTILLENDANRTVEFFRKSETRITSSDVVYRTTESNYNATLIEQQQTLAVTADELIGNWVIDNLSEFGGYSSAVSVELLSGGTGTLIDNDNAPVSVTWQVDGNRLLISNSTETISYDIAIWLVKNVQVGYQFAASLEAKADDSSRTVTGLMVRDNQLSFTKPDLLGKWTVYQGYNSPQTDLHYDVYDDGLMNFNLNQNFRSWQVSSEGVFLRYNYFTSNGVQPICPEGEVCQVYSEFSQRLLATNNGQNFTYRKYRFFNYDGSERVEDYSSHLRNFSVSDEYGVTKFAPYWLEENASFDNNGYPITTNYIELYSPRELGVETIKIATIYDEMTAEYSHQITFTYLGVVNQYDYSLASGKLLFDSMKAEVSDFDRNFLTICVYEQAGSCTEDAKQAWYFDKAMAEEQVVVERPATDHPLDGAWQLADEPDVAVIIRDGKWLQIQGMDDPDDDTAFPGFEIGDFTWDETTGAFDVTITEDTNGSFGIDDAGSIVASVDGDTLTFDIEGEGIITLSRIYSESNPLIGGYTYGSYDGDFFIAVFKEDGTFLELAHDTEFDELGISGGYYTYDAETQKVEVDFYVKTYGDPIELADPYFIVKPQGNFIQFKDGDDFGLFERVTRVIDQAAFTEADLIGSHVFTFMADDGSGLETSNVVISNDGTATFELDGEVRSAEWALDLGSLMMYSEPTATQNYGYGVTMTPVITIEGGFSVATLGFEVPETYDDNDDPELHTFVSGSLIKQ